MRNVWWPVIVKYTIFTTTNLTRPYVQGVVAELVSTDAVVTCIDRSLERRITHSFCWWCCAYRFGWWWCVVFWARLTNCSDYHFALRFATKAGEFFLLYLGLVRRIALHCCTQNLITLRNNNVIICGRNLLGILFFSSSSALPYRQHKTTAAPAA